MIDATFTFSAPVPSAGFTRQERAQALAIVEQILRNHGFVVHGRDIADKSQIMHGHACGNLFYFVEGRSKGTENPRYSLHVERGSLTLRLALLENVHGL